MFSENLMSRMAWIDVKERLEGGAVVLLPIGAQEGHGHHAPLGTDTIIGHGICESIANKINALIAPAVPFGYKSQPRTGGGHHFSGNIGLDGEVLIKLIRCILKDLADKGAKHIAIVNAHFENSWFITEACSLAMEEAQIKGLDYRIFYSDWWSALTQEDFENIFNPAPADPSYEHAALVETSMIMQLAPETINLDKVPPDDHDFVVFPSYATFPVDPELVKGTGCMAPVLNADAEKGNSIIELAAEKLATGIITEFDARSFF